MAWKKLMAPILAGLGAMASLCGEVLTPSTGMTSDGGKVDSQLSGGRITGQMAAGWRDNSEWARAWVDYRPVTEGDHRFLRVNISRIDSGYNQLLCPVRLPDRAAAYRLSLRMRMKGRSRVVAGIRMIDKPYSWLYKNSFAPDGVWRNYSSDFSLAGGAAERKLAILLQIDSPAILDIMDVRLETIAPVVSSLSRADDANWFRNSSFVLGLPSGWSLHNCFSEGDMVQVKPDPTVTGPSGAPALLVDVPAGAMTSYDYRDRMEINSAPLLSPAPGQDAVASLALRGRGEGSWIILCGNRKVVSVPFKLNGGEPWQRVEAKFRSGPGLYTARLEVKGKIWIDHLRVSAVETAVKPLTFPETALALKSGDAALAGVSFSDEPMTLRYAVVRPAAGTFINLKTVNLYGDEKLYRLPLTAAKNPLYGELKPELPAGHELGPLRFEAWVTDNSNNRISPYAELLVNRLPRPRYWGKDAPSSAFGIHVQPSNRHLTMAKAIGANWARLHDAGVQLLGWAYLERKPGQWTFDDAGVDRYRNHKIKLLGELTTAPAWESYATRSTVPPPTLMQSVTSPYFLPLVMKTYEDYCRKLIARYGDRIDSFDVWNEPWLPLFFHIDFVRKFPTGKKHWASFSGGWYISPDDPAADFIKMQQTVFKTAKAANPGAKVLGFNTTDSNGSEGRVPGDKFTGRMEQLGAMNSCDVICYHQYLRKITGYPGDEVDIGYNHAFAPLLKKYGKSFPHPVWLSEGSPLSGPGDGFYRHTVSGGSPSEMFDYGDRVVRFVVSLLAHRVEKVFLYSMGLHRGYADINPHGLFITPAGELHSAAGAYAAMTWLLEDRHFVRMAPVGKNVFVYLFAGRGEVTAVLLPDPRSPDFSLTLPAAAGLQAFDLFGNPLPSGPLATPYACYLVGKGTANDLLELLSNQNKEK